MILINQQVTYMKTEDPGFKSKDVLYIDNLTLFNSPRTFEPVRNQIKSIPGVKNVSVASNIPAGIAPALHEYTIRGKALAMHSISVDYEYFETLNIERAGGVVFHPSSPADSINAVINETAARAMGIENPVGLSIDGCGGRYKIIGIVKDVKAYGFEEKIQPTIYLMKDQCGLAKTQIMVSANQANIPGILQSLSSQWKDINKLDGDNFNHHFLDELYGRLFVKQEQLRMVLIFFSSLAIAIASLGLFASAAHSIRLRMKEIAIRKVFGANTKELIVLISKPFFKIVIIANLIAWPATIIIVDKWLETFAYQISVSITPFIIAAMLSCGLVILTVCLQVRKAVKFNPNLWLR
jgi:putative ABC transport system permease protein